MKKKKLFFFQNSIPYFENGIDLDKLTSNKASLSASTLFVIHMSP